MQATKLNTIARALALAGGLAAGTQAHAIVFSQCPSTDGAGNPIPAAQKECRHLSAGDGWVFYSERSGQAAPAGGAAASWLRKRAYTFGFNDVTARADADVMAQGTFSAKWPAPPLVFGEGKHVFMSLTNVGMAHRPDLFDPHSIHWHGFPQAAPVFDGVPEGSATVNMGSTLTYYYKPNDPGSYIYHCHVESAEHMHMGMLGSLVVTPKQNGTPFPHPNRPGQFLTKFGYNDADGSTGYDVDYALQTEAFNLGFHELHEAIQPLPFADMRATHPMINGRGYPDTVQSTALPRVPADLDDPASLLPQSSQQVSALVTAKAGDRVLLRLTNVSVAEYFTLTALGLRMKVVATGAAIARGPKIAGGDEAQWFGRGLNVQVASGASANVQGRDWGYETNSVTLGGGEGVDVMIDTAGVPPGTYYLYSTNLNYLSNGADDRGGLMTHIVIN